MKLEDNNDFHDWLAKMKEESKKEKEKRERQINTLNWISVTCFISAFVSLVVYTIIAILRNLK